MSSSNVSLLYPLADALQTALVGNDAGRIVEAVPLELNLTKEVLFPVSMDVSDSFINAKKQQVGGLFHVAGDLYILVTYAASVQTACLYVLDASKHKKKWRQVSTPKIETIPDFVRRGASAIVAGWSASPVSSSACRNVHWVPMKTDLLKKLLGESDDQSDNDGEVVPASTRSSVNN